MSWFKRDKNKSVIPPVEAPPVNRAAPSPGSSAPPSYRSSANTYIPSRDGDLSDPRAYGNLQDNSRQDSGGQGGRYGDRNNYSNSRMPPDDGYGSVNSAPPTRQQQYRSRNEYGVMGGVSDPYARGERDIDADRNALFSGSAPPAEGRSNSFRDGPSGGRPPPMSGQEEEEDVEETIKNIRSVKQDTVSSTRNALRIAREAEETGRATLLRLGEQSEKIADTERNIDVSKGHALRAEDNADEIKKLNRSIFIPAITFNKDAKRMAQERKREQRYQEEMTEREVAMQDIRESQNRVGRAATFGRNNSGGDDGEGIGAGRRQLTSTQQSQRKEERKRYQFEATESDDEMEDEIDDNLDEILDATNRMKALGLAMGSELKSQNTRLGRITDKTDRLGQRVDMNTAKLNRIAR